MGFFLIGIILLIIGVICIIWYNYSWSEAPIIIGVLSGLLGGIILITSIFTCVSVQITKLRDYEDRVYEKSILEYRLKNEINVAGNEMLYKDIVEFNKNLRSTKYWSKNFWVNWYNNDLIEDIDYIKIDDIIPENILNKKGE